MTTISTAPGTRLDWAREAYRTIRQESALVASARGRRTARRARAVYVAAMRAAIYGSLPAATPDAIIGAGMVRPPRR